MQKIKNYLKKKISVRRNRVAAMLVKLAARIAASPSALRIDPAIAKQANTLTKGRIICLRVPVVLDNRPLNEMRIVQTLQGMVRRDLVTFHVQKVKGRKPVLVGDLEVLREKAPQVKR